MTRLMTCDYTSCETVFQSDKDNEFGIMDGCVLWNSTYDRKYFRLQRDSNQGQLCPQISVSPTELPENLWGKYIQSIASFMSVGWYSGIRHTFSQESIVHYPIQQE